MRHLIKLGLTWDTEITNDHVKPWMDYCSDLEHLGEVAFPRYSLNSEKSCRLHLFCDASKEAYGWVLYAEQDHKTNLIFSKSKLSPKLFIMNMGGY